MIYFADLKEMGWEPVPDKTGGMPKILFIAAPIRPENSSVSPKIVELFSIHEPGLNKKH